VKRLLVPGLALLVLVLAELWLGRALAEREPLQAFLTGKLWVAGFALAGLGARLLLFLVMPGWLLAAAAEAWLSRR